MHVGELFDLQRPFQTSGEVVTAAHHQQRLLLVDLVCNLQHLLVKDEHLLDLV